MKENAKIKYPKTVPWENVQYGSRFLLNGVVHMKTKDFQCEYKIYNSISLREAIPYLVSNDFVVPCDDNGEIEAIPTSTLGKMKYGDPFTFEPNEEGNQKQWYKLTDGTNKIIYTDGVSVWIHRYSLELFDKIVFPVFPVEEYPPEV